jgi:hypothetical protein
MAQYKSNEEYQKELLQHFDDLTPQELRNLIAKCGEFLSMYEHEDERYDFISSIISTAVERKSVTFKQWKALSAFSRDCQKITMVETKSKSLEDPIEFKQQYNYPNAIPSGMPMNSIDVTKLTPAQFESYQQNESKNKLGAEMNKMLEEAFADRYKITKEGKAIKKK